MPCSLQQVIFCQPKIIGRTVLDDIWILRLNYMVWCEVNIYKKSTEARYLFGCGVCESRIYIFGGMNDENYIGGKMIVLETDESLGIVIFFDW